MSLFHAFSKIFEIIICSRLTTYFDNNILLVNEQHGSRSHHSTESVILQFVSDVYQCLKKKTPYVVGVFIDLSKATDT